MAASLPRKIWQTFAAIKTGVILLILVVILSAAGTIILQRPATDPDEMQRAYSPLVLRLLDGLGLTDVFHAWWFVLLLSLVSLTIIVASVQRFPNAWRFFSRPYKSPDEAFRNARFIADACTLDLAQIGPGGTVHGHETGGQRLGDKGMTGKERLPGFVTPDGQTAFSFLYALCQDGARAKYGQMTPRVSRQLAHELDVIERCGLAEFFLINWDIVRFCKEHQIPAQGRGSAADSIVAYVLDITKVDPIAHDLLFERFLTEDSRTMPDIDLDIATNDREDVIQYVYKKYGERA